MADLRPTIGSEQGGVRPVLILQNDVGNQCSNTTIAAPITGRIMKPKLPTHVQLKDGILRKESVILLEQMRAFDKSRIRSFICKLPKMEMRKVEKAIQISLEIDGRSVSL